MYWKKLQLLRRRHIHRTQVVPSFAFACEVKGKGPNLEGKRGLTGTLVNWVLWQLAAHTSCSLVMSAYSFALLYEYLMRTWWEHIGNFKNPKDPKILPSFPPGKEKKKNWTFWVPAALSHGLWGIYVPNGVQRSPMFAGTKYPSPPSGYLYPHDLYVLS